MVLRFLGANIEIDKFVNITLFKSKMNIMKIYCLFEFRWKYSHVTWVFLQVVRNPNFKHYSINNKGYAIL